MAVGIPLYVCSTASVPIAAALLMKGVSPGAALVFLITGAATNAAGVATVWSVLGRRTALIYLGTVVVTALLSGSALNMLMGSAMTHHLPSGAHAEMLPGLVSVSSAIFLLVLMVGHLAAPLLRRQGSEARCAHHCQGHAAEHDHEHV
jgi:hypothetical protein